MKNIKLNKEELVKEHKRIVPELRKHGLKREALRQAKELKELKRK
jgi:hypothetical protein